MPSTRSDTPGPSDVSKIALKHRNTSKRVLSDDEEEEDHCKGSKRAKQENQGTDDAESKDKKRRKKKKKKLSVVAVTLENGRVRPRVSRHRRVSLLEDKVSFCYSYIGR